MTDERDPTQRVERDEAWEKHHNAVSHLIGRLLGKEHDRVFHALFPFAVGGGLDLYVYPHHIPGTAIATKELTEDPDRAPGNHVFETYELVMFTKHAPDPEDPAEKPTDGGLPDTPFGKAVRNINAILNPVAQYAFVATLNPCETMEFPKEMDVIGGQSVILDAYGEYDLPEQPPPAGNFFTRLFRRRPAPERIPFGLLAVIEVQRVELDFAREHGGQALLDRLKAAGHYPYSDLDREPVV